MKYMVYESHNDEFEICDTLEEAEKIYQIWQDEAYDDIGFYFEKGEYVAIFKLTERATAVPVENCLTFERKSYRRIDHG